MSAVERPGSTGRCYPSPRVGRAQRPECGLRVWVDNVHASCRSPVPPVCEHDNVGSSGGRRRSFALLRGVDAAVKWGLVPVVVCLCVVAPSAAMARSSATRDCGDIRAATWSTREGTHSITGSYYSVGAINFPCATARRLAAKMTYTKSAGTGFNRKLLPGYTCLVSVPPGFRLSRGGCSVGVKVTLMDPNIKSFTWHVCQAVPARNEHLLCSVRRT